MLETANAKVVILRGVSGHVTQANTKESDLQPKVWNTVTDQFGGEHQIFSSDPLSAIEEFTNLKKTIDIN